MLRALDAATRPEQVNLPGFYWHPLQAKRAGHPRQGKLAHHLCLDGADAVAVDLEITLMIERRVEPRCPRCIRASCARGDPAGVRATARRDCSTAGISRRRFMLLSQNALL